VNSALTLSIVIPVYNEERYIKHCLDAIKAQTVMPLEVIIVDNNCTDKTIEIAEKYDFVKVVNEPRQGRGYARSTGFDAAGGDIIGRIDADSIPAKNWVERATSDFQNDDIAGVTGLGMTNVILGFSKWYTTFWSRMYFWTAHSIFRALTMWGANMAIRRSVWQLAKPDVCLDDKEVHEDQDLSMVILGQGGRIIQDDKLLIRTSGRSLLYWPKFWDYFKRTFTTRDYHLAKNTLKKDNPLRSKLGEIWFGAAIGWLFTGLFFIYSLLCWPIFVFSKKLYRQAKTNR
jgi:glycosyltransferase involved in cell wall biosynthesis